MTLSKTQIIALRDAVNKHVGKNIDMASEWYKEYDVAIRKFQKALPDIAQTAIDALERVEVLEKEKLRERVDERISTLEKVQKLIIEHKASPELMDDVMGILKNPIGDWNPTV